ncbi:PTS mannose transporter subunit IID [Terrilactibacillus sp. BCM23-1]|uniref:PTS mannose transporter subunit IID n=1 Tax=Terrilactibacillus tamarindi TaxID=2599694 RepID=A0A6N8CSC5_9BACI|nr:PTS mannose transporter subunit IID [Terrilactibacillus tamarindi]MTT32548.1 PTS mannose transporter subunit IID [Terrilactibacillus tamarindi]
MSEQVKTQDVATNGEKKLTKKDLFSMFIRNNFLLGSFNFERMQAVGFCFSMIPAIKRLYKGDERKKALKRHLEFFNTQPFLAAPIVGVSAAMEEQKANGAPIDDSTISGVKVGLMGPLAGVGDPIFWGTLRPVIGALGASLAITGNIIGPLVFLVFFNILRLATKYYGIQYGYKKGLSVISDLEGNRLQKLTEGASILGLFVMGALVCKWTSINVPVVLAHLTDQTGHKTVTTVQSVLDSLLPGLLPLLLTFFVASLLKKKVNPLWLIFGIFAVGILGYWLKILA